MARFGELSAEAVWAAATRTLTAAPDMSTAQLAAIWAAATRTLTDFSAEEIFDLPIFDSVYGIVLPASSATADQFGSWVQISADVGTGKRLLYIAVISESPTTSVGWELEIGEGGSGSEAAVARIEGVAYHASTVGWVPGYLYPVFKSLTDNARLTVRVRDNKSVAYQYDVQVMIA